MRLAAAPLVGLALASLGLVGLGRCAASWATEYNAPKLVSDIKLLGMPIGRDDTQIHVADYGPGGRHSAPDKLKILRIPAKAGTEGFKH